MKKTSVVHARIEQDTKSGAEAVLHALGLNPTEAIRMFYRQIALRRGIPFPVEIPNSLTQKTLRKSRRGKGVRSFKDLDDLAASWKK